MRSFQTVACAILVCMAIGGTSGDYYNNYGNTISKVVVYGKDKVVLPTMKNMMIMYSGLMGQASKYAPKAIRSDLENFVYKINTFPSNTKELLKIAESILYKIEKGYISDCDYAKQMEEAIRVYILLISYCAEDYTYYNYNYKN